MNMPRQHYLTKVFSQPDCQPCRASIRWLTSHGVDHQVIDVSVDDEAMALVRSWGFTSTPVVSAWVDGECVAAQAGFRPLFFQRIVDGELTGADDSRAS